MSDAVLGVHESIGGKEWQMRHSQTCEEEVLDLARQHRVSEMLIQCLLSRNISADNITSYLNPTLRGGCPDPYVLKDMEKAALRLACAIQKGEKIAVLGDYDVDGTTSCTLLTLFFQSVKAQIVCNYIPDRIKEGYGPNREAMALFKKMGATLVITLDCGTCAFEPLAYAHAEGMDVMVIDHHQVSGVLPTCTALVNPQQEGDSSGLGYLAAVGLTFMLLVATNRCLRQQGWYTARRPEPDIFSWLDIVALGTVCDMVPLVELNRIFVFQGLGRMKCAPNAGIAALLEVAGVTEAPSAYHLGFVLGPRINAGGRIGYSDMGFKLLTTHSCKERTELAKQLHALNFERQTIEGQIVAEASAMAEQKNERISIFPPPAIIVHADDWHVGVIGIVASRLVMRYKRPSLVMTFDSKTNMGKGSGRSVAGVDLGGLIQKAVQAGHLHQGGGHSMAVGFSLARPQLDGFSKFICDDLEAFFQQRKQPPAFLDGLLTLEASVHDLMCALNKLGPHGSGNPKPCFVFPFVRVQASRVVGKDHVSCVLCSENTNTKIKAIAFQTASNALGKALLSGGRFHILGHLQENKWQQRETVQIVIEDAAFAT